MQISKTDTECTGIESSYSLENMEVFHGKMVGARVGAVDSARTRE